MTSTGPHQGVESPREPPAGAGHLSSWERLLRSIAILAAGEDSAADLRLRRTLLFMLAAFSSVAGVVWGTIYVAVGEWELSLLPYGYALLSAPSLFLGRLVGNLDRLIRVQLALIMAVPFLLSVALGGFVGSSSVVLWALLGPVGAFLISGRRGAVRWLLVYLCLVAITPLVALDPGSAPTLSAGVRSVFFVLNVGSVSAIAFGLLYYFVGENQRVLELLRLEKYKSERLLLNILPKEVADVLRDEEHTIADQYDSVSILFADIVGFTPLSAKMDAEEIVGLLNQVFSHFDELVDEHGVEKVRTIGDNYMVVAGAPRRHPNHAHALAEVALGMMSFLDEFALPDGSRLQFRIGINTGPVVAGVIGIRKFQYDVWGDAVNVASRMESHGIPGKIQIGPATFALVQDRYRCVRRGSIDVKGKGRLDAWILEDRIDV
jgi:guanylate cyclase